MFLSSGSGLTALSGCFGANSGIPRVSISGSGGGVFSSGTVEQPSTTRKQNSGINGL
jgi:hypothetical protein